MYFQCATHASVGIGIGMSVCDPITVQLIDKCLCVLCCRLICWQRNCAYELYSVLISTLHSDHYIRFLR